MNNNSQKINNLHDLQLQKERLRYRIQKSENEINANFDGLVESLTPEGMKNMFVEAFLSRPDLVVKGAFFLVSLIKSKANSRRK